jgi:small membrane protein
MIIRILLLAGLAAIGWLVFLRRNRMPVHIVLVFALLACGGAAVVFPDLTQRVADAVGVGRGADLVTYLVEVGTLFVLLHYFTKFVELERKLTDAVRELAILRAEVERLSPPGAPPKTDEDAA